MSCNSQIAPLQLTFSNVTLTTDGLANTNGIALQIGTPGQLLALTPSTLLNDTIITNRAICGSNASAACIQSIGGGFDASASTSFLPSTIGAWNGSLAQANPDIIVNTPSTYFNDVLTVSSDQSSHALPGFPLILTPAANSIYSQLGIGQNSTFIRRVVEAGLAPSRSWSFFAGVYSQLRAGSLIIGGYASRYHQGDLITKNVTASDDCDVCFTVTGMTYQTDEATTDLMPDGASSFRAIVDPWYPVMIVSNSTLNKFGNATNGVYDAAGGVFSYSSRNVPTGNITITLRNNLTTTIPNRALFDPPAYDNGILSSYRNGSNATVYGVFSPWNVYVTDPPTTDVAIFGMPYAAFVYLVRDYERSTLSIANANQAASIGGSAEAICPLGEKSSGGGSSHTGAIAGGVVGGVVGLALIALLVWFFLRRRKRAAATAPESKDPDLSGSDVPTTTIMTGKPELATSGTVVQNRSSVEKPAVPVHQTQELPGQSATPEMPGTQAPPPAEMSASGNVVRSEMPATESAVRSEMPAGGSTVRAELPA